MAKGCRAVVEETQVVKKNVVKLTLSEEEAQFLGDVTGWGIIGFGRRKHSIAIYQALSALGFEGSKGDFSGNLHFKGDA